MENIKCIDHKLVHDGTCLRAYSDTMSFPGGHTEEWDIIEHKFNAAAVIPVLPNGNILLVKQFRSTVNRLTWEIPAGKRDDDGAEDPLVCAKRELMEETGFYSDDIEYAFTLMPSVAYSTETVDIYVARNIEKRGEQHLDEGEFINIKEWDIPTLKNMIRNGQIQDSKTIAAVYFL